MDNSNTGKISNLQFRKAMRNFNIGLTSKEIDILIQLCDTNKNG